MQKVKRGIGTLVMATAALAALCCGAAERPPLRVLAIGNSFSVCLQHHWPKVAEALGEKLDLGTLYIGGCPFERHANNIRESEKNPKAKQYAYERNTCGEITKRAESIPGALQEEKWDVVTIQQVSHLSCFWDSYHPWADEVIACVRRLAPQARIVVQQTWAYSNRDGRIFDAKTGGAGTWGFDQAGMYRRLTENYRRLASEYGFALVPTGEAVERFRRALPVKKVEEDVVGKKGDPIHLNGDGDYLQALTWSAALFGDDVTACAYVPKNLKKDPARAALIRRVASETGANGALLDQRLDGIFAKCAAHYRALEAAARAQNGTNAVLRLPHSYDAAKGKYVLFDRTWWTAGHFPGSLWQLYEATGDGFFRERAKAWTELLSTNAWINTNHDIGFIMYCSYGNARRLLKTKEYDPLLLQTAKTLCERYNEKLGLIRSWGPVDGKNDFLVIPDNLMNLELLEWASKNAPDWPTRCRFRDIAASHADVTMRHHYRADAGCYHVLDYDQQTLRVKGVMRGQGASVETAWSRGQSWSVYGYTMMYRMTGMRRYLDMAIKCADFAAYHANLPDDGIPYWDYGAPGEERDTAAGSILASALLELSTYADEARRDRYRALAEKQLVALASPDYFSAGDEIGHFLLKHGTGHKPGHSEIDVPLDYGDYYFLEALLRYRALRTAEKARAALAEKLPVKAGVPVDECTWRGRACYPEDPKGTLVEQAEALLKEKIPDASDALYGEFWTTGNRTHYERPFFRRLGHLDTLAEAEAQEQKGRFVKRIEDYLNAICAMKSWVLPAHDWTDGNRGTFRGTCPSVDLFCSEVGAHLACVLALVGDQIDPRLVARVKAECERRIFAPLRREIPFHFGADGRQEYCANVFHWWMDGDNNWNAVCWDNVVCTALGMLDDPMDRAYFVGSAEKSIDYYLKGGFAEDGYCSEGMGYWNYGFGHHLTMGHLLNRLTDGKVNIFTDPRQKKAAAYARAYTLADGVSPAFADGNGAATKQNLALVDRYWPDLPKDLPAASEFPAGQVWLLRDPNGLSVAFKGGHNGEHHNHNDLGSYWVVSPYGKLLGGDAGAEVYTRFTFSAQRYESKVLNSYGHPVPVVGGRLQLVGCEHAAKVLSKNLDGEVATVVLDLSGGYDVKALKALTRTFVYDRKAKTFAVTDRVEFTEPTAFETAYLAFFEEDQAGAEGQKPHRWDPKARGAIAWGVRPQVTAEGGTWKTVEEKIPNPARLAPRRVAVRFDKPVTAATATVTYAARTGCVTSPDALRVGSYNIRMSPGDRGTPNAWENRRADLVAQIRDLDLDAFGLQEVCPDQMAYLREQLPEFAFVGDHREADRKSGEASPVVYRRSRFEAEKSGTFWLSETPDVPASTNWGTCCTRVCSYLVLRDRTTDLRFCFANTHTDHISAEAREKGMLLIVKRMKAFGAGAPIVFTGDHNCCRDEAPAKAVRAILRDARDITEKPCRGPHNTFHGFGAYKDGPVGGEGAVKDYCIDYIYVSDGTRVFDFVTHGDKRPGTDLYPSDHFPVTATISFRPARR